VLRKNLVGILGGCWELLGGLWAFLTGSWGLLRPPGALLPPLGVLLGGSWGLLKPPGAHVGSFTGALEHILGQFGGVQNLTMMTCQNRRTFEPNMGSTMTIFGPSKGSLKSTKIDSKMDQNLRRFSRAKKLLSKSLLEPSWADPGAFWEPSWGQQQRSGIGIRSTGAKFMIFMLIGFQDAFWSQLGRSWPPKVPKMTPRWHPKTTPNRSKIDAEKLSKF
jgi:hypothetical protein